MGENFKKKKNEAVLFFACAVLEKRSFCALITVYGLSQDKQSILNAAQPIGPIPN